MHSHVWDHTPGTPPPTLELLERYCEAAAAHGIAQIAITEHCYRFTRIASEVLPHWGRPRNGPLSDATEHILDVESGGDLDQYVDVLVQAQEAGLPILVGLEVDYLPGAMTAMAAVLDEYPFDVLLGSVHWLDEWLFDDYGTEVFANQWKTRDTSAVYTQYVDSILDLATSGVVDVLAHLDVIKVAGYRPSDLYDHEDRLVAGLAKTNMVVELSSAGLTKPGAETYPSDRLFGALVKAGVDITTASDAHTPDKIGTSYDELTRVLRSHDVTTLTTFKRREPSGYALR